MNKKLRLSLVVLLMAVCVVRAEVTEGWSLIEREDGSCQVIFRNSGGRFPPAPLQGLLDFLDTLDKKALLRLRSIDFNEVFQSEQVQKELLAEFSEKHPQLLKNAKTSSGNMHNPKVLPLGAAFAEAMLATPSVREVDKRLAPSGVAVSRVSFEKFSFEKGTDPIRFYAIVNLMVAPKTENPEADDARPAR